MEKENEKQHKNGMEKRKGVKRMQYYRFAESVIIAGPRNAHRRPLILSPFYFALLLMPFPIHVLGLFSFLLCLPSSLFSLFSILPHSSTSQTVDLRRLRTAVLPWYIIENKNFDENVTGASDRSCVI